MEKEKNEVDESDVLEAEEIDFSSMRSAVKSKRKPKEKVSSKEKNASNTVVKRKRKVNQTEGSLDMSVKDKTPTKKRKVPNQTKKATGRPTNVSKALPSRPDQVYVRKRLGIPPVKDDDSDDEKIMSLSSNPASTDYPGVEDPHLIHKLDARIQKIPDSGVSKASGIKKPSKPKVVREKRKRENDFSNSEKRKGIELMPKMVELTRKDMARSRTGVCDGVKEYIGEIDSSKGFTEDASDDLMLKGDGVLICPTKISIASGTSDKAGGEEEEQTVEVPKIQEVSGADSLTLAVKNYYVPSPQPRFSIDSPIVGSDFNGAVFQGKEDAPILHLEDGRVIGVSSRGDERVTLSSTVEPSLLEDEIARGVFSGTLGSGQSLSAIRNVTRDITDKVNRENHGEEEFDDFETIEPMEDGIEMAINDTIAPLGVGPCLGVKNYGYPKESSIADRTSAFVQKYLYKHRRPIVEYPAIMDDPKFGFNYGMSYAKMDDTSRYFANVSIRTRNVEESFMREPRLDLGEQPCGEGEACEGLSIPGGFTLVAYPSPSDCLFFEEHHRWPQEMRGGQCVLCARATLFMLYARVESVCRAYRSDSSGLVNSSDASTSHQSGSETGCHYDQVRLSSSLSKDRNVISTGDSDIEDEIEMRKRSNTSTPMSTPLRGSRTGIVDFDDDDVVQPLMLCNFTNLVGPGEYAPSSCITAASSGQFKGFPGCFVIHSRDMYSTVKVDGIKWVIQHYPKPVESSNLYRSGGDSVISKSHKSPPSSGN